MKFSWLGIIHWIGWSWWGQWDRHCWISILVSPWNDQRWRLWCQSIYILLLTTMQHILTRSYLLGRYLVPWMCCCWNGRRTTAKLHTSSVEGDIPHSHEGVSWLKAAWKMVFNLPRLFVSLLRIWSGETCHGGWTLSSTFITRNI